MISFITDLTIIRSYTRSKSQMTASDLDTCNFAYEGKLEQLINSIDKKPEFLNKRDSNERSPIHWACSSGRRDVVEYLVEKQAEMNEQDDAGTSNDSLIIFFVFPKTNYLHTYRRIMYIHTGNSTFWNVFEGHYYPKKRGRPDKNETVGKYECGN